MSKQVVYQLIRYGIVGIATNLLGYGIYLLVTYLGVTPKVTVSIFYPIGVGILLNIQKLPMLEINNFIWGIPVILAVVIFTKYWISKHINIRFSMYFLILSLSSLGQLTDLIIVYILCKYFALNITFGNLMIIMPLVYIATVLPISIGGLGVREGTMVGLLSLFSVEVSIAVIISFMMYLSKVGVGLVGLPFFLKFKGSRISD